MLNKDIEERFYDTRVCELEAKLMSQNLKINMLQDQLNALYTDVEVRLTILESRVYQLHP